MTAAKIILGDCIATMQGIPDASVDAIVTDPPYGLGFRGKAWDELPPGREWAEECLRVLKPGGHLLAFGGSRTWHRLAVAIEDAGFEVRDSIAWLYGSGFPKSLDVSKAIDKAAGATREVTPEAEQRQGWGTALKPAFEPIVVARKPLRGTVAANVLEHGTGALNIDGCRIGTDGGTKGSGPGPRGDVYDQRPGSPNAELNGSFGQPVPGLGRWPANVILDEDQAAALDEQSGNRPGFSSQRDLQAQDGVSTTYGGGVGKLGPGYREGYNDSGGASRFFYVAKAPKKERPIYTDAEGRPVAHPTVKPLTLMRWLVRLVTPPGGLILDPFAGSGATVEAALLEGFRITAIEREADYIPLIEARIQRAGKENAA